MRTPTADLNWERSVGRSMPAATGRRLRALGVLALMSVSTASAQIGLASGASQATLVVRSAPRASALEVGSIHRTGRNGDLTHATMDLQLSAISPYRLVIRGVPGATGGQVWVQAVDGTYHQVVAGSSVTVAHGAHAPAHSRRQVKFQFDRGVPSALSKLPVRYELVMVPKI